MKEVFNDIIEKDEKIIKIFKPQKTRFWWGIILSAFSGTFFFLLWLGGMFWAILTDTGTSNTSLVPIIIIGYLIIVLLPTLIFGNIAYKNRFYAYSNKRILIRSGIIGVDYRTLEYQALTATMVHVSFLDKILGTKTGTLNFGSPSSPVGMTSGGSRGVISSYSFKSIEKPYDTLREIKEFMDKK